MALKQRLKKIAGRLLLMLVPVFLPHYVVSFKTSCMGV